MMALPRAITAPARALLGPAAYQRARFIGKYWLPVYLPRFLRRQMEIATEQPAQLEDMFVFLTNQCNARCKHCFYIDELGYVPGEMLVDEYREIAPTLPKLRRLIFTGGEALLHPECREIVAVLAHATQAEEVTIITNGFLPDKVEQTVLALLDEDRIPGLLDILVSMDGLEPIHNHIRGNKKAWTNANETLARLSRIKAERMNQHNGHGHGGGRLDAGVITIVTDKNWRDLEPLDEHIRATHPHIRHGFEFIRGTSFSLWNLGEDLRTEYDPPGTTLPPREEWDNILATIQRINRRAGNENHAFTVTNFLTVEMLRTGEKQVDCVSAGQNVAVLYPTGEIALCEFSKAVGNIRDYGHDFRAIWNSPAADVMRAGLSQCHCTHGCYLSKNVEMTLPGQLAMLKYL